MEGKKSVQLKIDTIEIIQWVEEGEKANHKILLKLNDIRQKDIFLIIF